MRNVGTTGAAVAPSFAQPDLPREERTPDIAAWRAGNEAKGQQSFVSPIAQARAERAAREAAEAAVRGPISEPLAEPEPAHEPVPAPPVKSAPPAAPRKPAAPVKPRKPAPPVVAAYSDADLAERYVAGATVFDLAVRYGLTHHTIRRRLRRIGVTIRDERRRDVDDNAIAQAYRDGATTADIAAQHDCDTEVVRRVLREAGIAFRSRSAATRSDELNAEMVRLYTEDNLSAHQVGLRVGRSPNVVLDAVRKAGHPVRPAGTRKSTQLTAPPSVEIRKALADAGTDMREFRAWSTAMGHTAPADADELEARVRDYLDAGRRTGNSADDVEEHVEETAVAPPAVTAEALAFSESLDELGVLARLTHVGIELEVLGQSDAAQAVARRAARIALRMYGEPVPA